MQHIVALVGGLLFGLGLLLSGMTDPGKVQGFLDVTTRWDPSLALVMGHSSCACASSMYTITSRAVAPYSLAMLPHTSMAQRMGGQL